MHNLLAGRPRHVTAGEHMDVEMIDGLTAVGARVYDEPKTAFVLRANPRRCFHQRRNFIRRPFERVLRYICDVALGQNEQVHRRLRVHVLDCDDPVLAMHDLRGYFACDYFAKNAIGGAHYLGCRYSKAMWVSGLGTKPA